MVHQRYCFAALPDITDMMCVLICMSVNGVCARVFSAGAEQDEGAVHEQGARGARPAHQRAGDARSAAGDARRRARAGAPAPGRHTARRRAAQHEGGTC